MKKALLWLCPLACLALACLFVYSWCGRDPLLVSFERIEVGMTMEKAAEIMGRSADHESMFHLEDQNGRTTKLHRSIWSSKHYSFQILYEEEGRAIHIGWERTENTLIDKAYAWVCDHISLGGSKPIPTMALPPPPPASVIRVQ